MPGASKRNERKGNAARLDGAAGSARDWLAEYAAKAGLSREAVESVRAWLSEQFVADEFAKLGQGGHAETRVALRRVFVDLPVARHAVIDPGNSSSEPFIREVLPSKPVRLAALCSQDRFSKLPEGRIPDSPSRRSARSNPTGEGGAILLIGGPGQGKSTLGQLACQLHRAALLRANGTGQTTSVQEVLAPFEKNADKNNDLVLPEEPLLPLRIVLPDAIAWFAKPENQMGEELAIVRFLAGQPSARKAKLETKTLSALVAVMPFFLLLDGFDEVGASEDRAQIVTITREFLLHFAALDARGIVLATTRPQGYAGELSGIGIPLVELYLVPLDRDEALRYATKLVEAKISGADEQGKIFARMQDAANEDATARLLRSPLQITIMAALVQQGRAPSERWKLFASYFDFTYRREIERDSYASKLLSDRRVHIEEIHRRVALILQVEGEQAGAGARMMRHDLSRVVDEVLKEDEIKDDERSDLVVRIVDAAEKRLVFLVEPEPGQFGFEIRSLQEFMAAWALTEGRESAVEARLLQIAKAPMFRHVVLFMSSRFFSQRSGLRDVLADRICGTLDEDSVDALARVTKMGAMLALEVLTEGSVAGQPKRERALMERACVLLDLPPGAEHERLVGLANTDTENVLRGALERRFHQATTNPEIDPLSSWFCVNLAANKRHGWAETLADVHANTLRDLGVLVNECIGREEPLSRWLVARILATPESVRPFDLLVSDLDEQPSRQQDWIGVFRQKLSLGPGARGISLPGMIHGDLVPIPLKPDADWAKSFSAIGSPSPMWRIWFAAAAFQCAPSSAALEKTLRIIAGNWQTQEYDLTTLADCVSWPIAACLNAAANSADLLRFADLAARGELGEIDQWLAAQARWAEHSSFHAVLDAIVDGQPWSKAALEKAPPLTAFGTGTVYVRTSQGSVAKTLVSHARETFRQVYAPKLRQILARLCLQSRIDRENDGAPSRDEVRAWLEEADSPRYLRRPKHASVAEWSGVLDCIVIARQQQDSNAWNRILAQHYIANPQNAAILFKVVEAFSSHARFSKREAMSLPLEPELERQLVKIASTQDFAMAPARADLMTLKVWLGVPTPADVVLDTMVEAAPEVPYIWSYLLEAIDRGRLSTMERETLLLRLARADVLPWHARLQVIQSLRSLAAFTRRSGLGDPRIWDRLELPAPHPKPPALATNTAVLPEHPVVITGLEVHHLRGIHKLELDLSRPEIDKGQWVVFLGPNGVGKTTLLRSLVLALRNLQDPKIWPKGAFESPWRQVEGPAVSIIQVKLEHQDIQTTRIRANGSESFFQDPTQSGSRVVPLFAYGCRRGSALGGAERAVELTEDDGPEVATLFHEGASLIHAETWLIRWDGDRNPRSRIIYNAVLAALRTILDVELIEVVDQNVWVREKDKPRVLFKALSDGYISTAGWVIDLIARWITLAERCKVPIDEKFTKRMTGLVLIDEIDLFLHPRWQVDVIERTRTLFPKMSFVVTTHNPLTLVGAKPEEIWILSMDNGRIQATRGQETPMLLTGGQIYNQYFGIRDLYPHELGRKLRRYGFLSGYALRTDEEQAEMEALRAELRAKGIDPGWEEVPREPLPSINAERTSAKKTTAKKARGTAS